MQTVKKLDTYTASYVNQSDLWDALYDLGVTPEQTYSVESALSRYYVWGESGLALACAGEVARCIEDVLPDDDARIPQIYALVDGVAYVNLGA